MADSTDSLTNIKNEDIRELISCFAKNSSYKSSERNERTEKILRICEELWNLDYKCFKVENVDGELCSSYPSRLIIPEQELTPELATELNVDSIHCSNGGNDGCDDLPPTITATNQSPLNLPSPSITPGNVNTALSFSAVVAGSSTASTSANFSQSSHYQGSSVRRKSSLSDSCRSGEESTSSQLRELIMKARLARCRTRFPIPCILYNGNYICRSATLSAGPEMYGRNFFSAVKVDDDEIQTISSDWQLFDKVRSQDIRLLKAYNVNVIIDLMVENKKLKFGFYITSSEKVDKENRYSEFNITCLPYPGCEFFKDFRDRNYSAEGLMFNWNQSFVDAKLIIPERTISNQLTSDWRNYRKWDLTKLTQNYMKLLLAYIYEGTNNGILVHCISGWDRTPLFISLVRMSLWADGVIHSSLDAYQILYLTIAYDWYLFGHDLKDRICRGEEIFYFCFYFLKYLLSDDFTSNRRRHVSNESYASDRIDSLSSAGSSNSLNSCSSKTSQSAANPFLKVGRAAPDQENYNANHTWPNGSFPDNDFDCPINKHNHTSPSGRGGWERSSLRESDGLYKLKGAGPSRALSDSPGSNTHSKNCKGACNGCSYDPEKCSESGTWRTNGHSESSSESFGSLSDVTSTVNLIEKVGNSSSPVAVPNPRSRNNSNNSVGSWQLVNSTGSLKGTTGSYFPSGSSYNSKASRGSSGVDMVDSSNTIKEEMLAQDLGSSVESDKSILVFNRERRLKQIRALFHTQYCSALGIKFNHHSDSWGSSIMSLVEKVSLATNS